MYKDFEDLRDNCPAEIQADIAVDFQHADPERLSELWPLTADGEFRLALVQRVTDFWENEVREKGGQSVPEDGFAIEILVDSFDDPDMGNSLYLELHAYCGTEGIGELAWRIFEDDERDKEFRRALPAQVLDLVERSLSAAGLEIEIEVTEVAEL